MAVQLLHLGRLARTAKQMHAKVLCTLDGTCDIWNSFLVNLLERGYYPSIRLRIIVARWVLNIGIVDTSIFLALKILDEFE